MRLAVSEVRFQGSEFDEFMKTVVDVRILMPILLMLLVLAPVSAFSQELRLITSPWPPSNYVDETGEPTGLSVEIVEALKKQLGLSTPIEVIPWARGYLTAKTTPNIMLFTGGRTEARENMGFEFIGPAVMWKHVLFAKTGTKIRVSDLDDVRTQNLMVAGVRGSWQIKLLKAAGIQTAEVADQVTGARMLLAGRVDLWTTSQLQASVILNETGFLAGEVKPVYTVRKSPSYLMISKDTDPDLAARWRTAFEELKKSGQLNEVAMKWSGKLGIPIRFSPDGGFYADLEHEDQDGS